MFDSQAFPADLWGGRLARAASQAGGGMHLLSPSDVAFLSICQKKEVRRGSTEPRRIQRTNLGNYERRSCYFFFLAAFLAAGFFAAFFFAAIIFYLLRLVIRTRGSMVWRA